VNTSADTTPLDSAAGAAQFKGVALAVISAITFSTLGLFAKLAYSQGMAPAQALAWRFSLAAVILWAVILGRGGQHRPIREYRNALLLGVLGFSPQAGLYFLAVRFLDPGIASLLLYLYPAFVVGMSMLFLKRKPRRAQMAALLASGLGCVLTLWTRGDYPAIGYVFGLAVALSYAAYLVAGERILATLDPVFATTNVMTAAAIVYWIITLASGAFFLPTTPLAIAGVIGIATIGSVIPIITLFASIRLIGSADASLVSTIEPLFTVLLSALLLGERFTALQLEGGALILAGVVILNLRPGRRRLDADSSTLPPPQL
jgi:drug/metabolite transporter (DMT)-like permease